MNDKQRSLKRPLRQPVASQSMQYSRGLQFTTDITLAMRGMDLAVSDAHLLRALSQISSPKGIPSSKDTPQFYEQVIQTFVGLIRAKALSSNILKKIDVNGIKASSFTDLIPQASQLFHLEEGKPYQDKFAFRLWFQSQSSNPEKLSSRILLLLLESKPPSESVGASNTLKFYQGIFGNVDVCIIPLMTTKPDFDGSLRIDRLSREHIKLMLPEDLVTISQHLDHGQMFNLAALEALGMTDLSHQKPFFSTNAYQQYFDDFTHYSRHSPNGNLMRRQLPNQLSLLHLTEKKPLIIKSKELRVSRAGCIGNMVYTTTLVGDDHNMLGGHTIGLYYRTSAPRQITSENFIYLDVENNRNTLTNWIEKLGRGRVLLETRNAMVNALEMGRKPIAAGIDASSYRTDAPMTLNAISHKAIEQYERFYHLFELMQNYRVAHKARIKQNPDLTEPLFQRAIGILEKIAYKPDGTPYFTIFNGIFFEIIKDYLIIFQSDELSIKYQTLKTFNMENQDLMFYELYPELRQNWNTNKFPVKIAEVFQVLTRWNFFKQSSDKRQFMDFFLSRLAHYVNVGCLEGTTKLPSPKHVTSFEMLVNYLPNLMGTIFNSIIKMDYKRTSLYTEYEHNTQQDYNTSYNDRQLDVVIKAGLCGTDEIGVRSGVAHVKFFDSHFQERNTLYSVTRGKELALSIRGVSDTNGFTQHRVDNPLFPSAPPPLTIIDINAPSFDLSSLARFINEHFYLTAFPCSTKSPVNLNPLGLFEIKTPKLRRPIHGAMHAARVATYVKIIHKFREKHEDSTAQGICLLAERVGLSAKALLHLTQIAALFHDTAREDEGTDRWDAQSGQNCFEFIQRHIPAVSKNMAQLIANTITFKDNEPGFIESAQALLVSENDADLANYLRQLVHDADCLDIIRTKKTFKMSFLDICNAHDLATKGAEILALVMDIRHLIHYQCDQEKPCLIVPHQAHLPAETAPMEANFEIGRKCEYEWHLNVLQAIIDDLNKYPNLQYSDHLRVPHSHP